MEKINFILKIILLCLLVNIARADNLKNWDDFSTVLAVGLPGLALYSTWDHKDVEGFNEFALSQGGTVAIAEIIKSQHHETRPDGSGNDSFPSLHTAVAFSAARFMDKRYDDTFAPLYYATAVLTGVSRVEAKKHYWRDTIAGGGLGYGMSELTTSKTSQLSALPTKGGFAIYWQKVLE